MIYLSSHTRIEFKSNILRYCLENGLELPEFDDQGSFRYTFYSIDIEPEDVQGLTNYIESLEESRKQYRKNKPWWWRLFN